MRKFPSWLSSAHQRSLLFSELFLADHLDASLFQPMNCVDRRRFLLSFARLFGLGTLPLELRGAAGGENELPVDFGNQGISSRTIFLVSTRLRSCGIGYSCPRTAPLFHSFGSSAQRV